MKLTLPKLITLFLLAAALPLAGQGLPIQSAVSLDSLSREWAKAFSAKNPGVTLDVKTGSAGAAFEALAKKQVQVVLAPRSIRFPELQACEQSAGARPVEFKLAVNGAAVYVHSDNPVKELSYEELLGLFSGKLVNWKDVGGDPGPTHVYGVATNSSVGELFLEEVMNGKPLAGEVKIVSADDLLGAIAKDKQAIGFGPLLQKQGVRAVGIKRAYSSTSVEPVSEDISSRVYPISRFIFGYAFPDASQAKAFLEWARNEEGQKLAMQLGYYQLPAKWRPKQ